MIRTIRTRRLAATAAVVACATAAGCGGDSDDGATAGGAGTVTITIGNLFDPTHPYNECGFQPLADEINEADAGLRIEIYPSGQLGNEQELLQSVQAGDVDMHVPGPGAVANFYQPVGVLDAAYVVDDWEHLRRVWESEVGDEFRAGTEEVGIRMLDAWYYGARHVTSDVPVRSPDDLSGLKVRAIDTPVSLANTRAMGAEPVPIAFDELYLALSQGVADGQENPIPTIETLRLYEVQDQLSLTGHLIQSGLVVISEKTWQTLTAEQQELLAEAVVRHGEDEVRCMVDAEQELLDAWRSGGMFDGIVPAEEIDLEAFRARVAAEVPEQFAGDWGEGRYEEIRSYAE